MRDTPYSWIGRPCLTMSSCASWRLRDAEKPRRCVEVTELVFVRGVAAHRVPAAFVLLTMARKHGSIGPRRPDGHESRGYSGLPGLIVVKVFIHEFLSYEAQESYYACG
jgi:hypothetical protein